MKISELLAFKGTWRTYQERVLKASDQYLKDGKIHIVAAPGSGKTTLGIELIRRIDRPALVLAPSVTIREQWIERIKEAFLKEGLNADDYFSQNLKSPKLITVATYQALHSAITRYNGTLIEDTEADTEESDSEIDVGVQEANEVTVQTARKEEVDFSNFDLVTVMRDAGVGVLCLDECHHLRSEWWKALEEFKEKSNQLQTISLTATPPYDSAPGMWSRYLNMCGDIDEEIAIPELVKEGSLCPHQDFVYFNYPTKEEEATVKKFQERSKNMLLELMQDEVFASVIQTHKCLIGLGNPDELLDEPVYLSSLLIFLQSKGIAFPKNLRSLIGAKKLPPMNLKWMQYLLQGLLYDDAESYSYDKVFGEQLIDRLKKEGLIERRIVTLVTNLAIEKLLMRSKGKSNSIRDIVKAEFSAMGSQLRLLILTDYIRKEYEAALGDLSTEIHSLGVLPFFEMLRREKESSGVGPKLGILCGTMVVIPACEQEALLEEIGEEGRVTFSKVGALSEQEYVKVNAIGDAHFLTGAVTALFSRGGIEVLIGTKSLLGEGWDSPCINSLIMASFVGSFMLSNQMRGRAIRTFKENPNKTSNIWHLVCLKPALGMNQKEDIQDANKDSEDFILLQRRMEHFLGLHYEENTIENGISRLSVIKPPLNRHYAVKINEKMLQMAAGRDELRDRWEKSLAVYDKMEIVDETLVGQKEVPAVLFVNAILAETLLVLFAILFGSMRISIQKGHTSAFIITFLLYFILAIMVAKLPKLFRLSTPLRRLKQFGRGILKALQKKGIIEDRHVKVETCDGGACYHAIYLKGGSNRDKEVFSKCISEFFDEIDNQRYILIRNKKRRSMDGYFCVPECLAKRKEDVQLLADCLKPVIGTFDAVYTRNPEGRKLLLEGRLHALANRQNRCITHKKVKSALE